MDTKSVLEAEKTILELAKELGRMRDAAELLQPNEEAAKEVIRSAESVVTATHAFTSKCGGVVERLAETDIHARLDAIVSQSEKTTKAVQGVSGLTKSFEESHRRLEGLQAKNHEFIAEQMVHPRLWLRTTRPSRQISRREGRVNAHRG